MENKNWLLSISEFNLMTNNYEWDWVLHKLWGNGITCPEDALMNISSARFIYTDPDCPFCGKIDKHYKLNSELWKCRNKTCYKKFTLTSGTYIADTKLEYSQWWRFAYLIGDLKITNSHVIAKDLDVTQLTAWRMIDTLRTARKESTKKKFVNGNEVLVFESRYDVLDILLRNLLRKKKISAMVAPEFK